MIICGVLWVIFITLKHLSLITWSWWWVAFLPVGISLTLYVTFRIVVVTLAVFYQGWKNI